MGLKARVYIMKSSDKFSTKVSMSGFIRPIDFFHGKMTYSFGYRLFKRMSIMPPSL